MYRGSRRLVPGSRRAGRPLGWHPGVAPCRLGCHPAWEGWGGAPLGAPLGCVMPTLLTSQQPHAQNGLALAPPALPPPPCPPASPALFCFTTPQWCPVPTATTLTHPPAAAAPPPTGPPATAGRVCRGAADQPARGGGAGGSACLAGCGGDPVLLVQAERLVTGAAPHGWPHPGAAVHRGAGHPATLDVGIKNALWGWGWLCVHVVRCVSG